MTGQLSYFSSIFFLLSLLPIILCQSVSCSEGTERSLLQEVDRRMLGAFLHHDAFLAEMVEPLLCHVRSQAEVDAHDASGDVTILLKILLDIL